MTQPFWATAIIEEVSRRKNFTKPKVTWYAMKYGNKGSYFPRTRKISLRVSGDEMTQRWLLLHELSHWLIEGRRGKSKGHTKEFWKTAFSLYDQYGVLEFAKDKEFSYMKKASEVYHELYSYAV